MPGSRNGFAAADAPHFVAVAVNIIRELLGIANIRLSLGDRPEPRAFARALEHIIDALGAGVIEVFGLPREARAPKCEVRK